MRRAQVTIADRNADQIVQVLASSHLGVIACPPCKGRDSENRTKAPVTLKSGRVSIIPPLEGPRLR